MKNLPLIFMLLLLVSCEYEPEKTFSRELDENIDPPKLRIIGLQPENPIILTKDTSLIFKFSATKNIRKIAFVVDDNSVNQVVTTGGIDGHVNELGQGRHILDIAIYTETGTTSIVDKLGAEGYKFETRWIITTNSLFHTTFNATIDNENSEIGFHLKKY